MAQLNLESAALILSMFCLIYSLTVNRKQYRLAKGLKNNLLNCHVIFILQLISLTVTTAASVGAYCLMHMDLPGARAWRYFLDIVYYLSHAFLSIGSALYIMDITGASMGRKQSFFLLFSLPCVLDVLLIVTNPLTGVCFYVDSHAGYHRGSWLPVLYACGLFYLVVSFLAFFRFSRTMSRVTRLEVGALMLLSVIGVMVQGLFPGLAVELFAESLL